jgi:uncharacterized protein (TIGR04255 family)
LDPIYETIKGQFPTRRPAKLLEVGVEAGPEGVRQSVKTTERMQFLQEDEAALVQVARDMLVVNHLKPYPTWSEFLPLIRLGLEAYQQAAKPKGLLRVGLRYINRVEFPGSNVELRDYFEFLPLIGDRLPQDYWKFMTGVEFPFYGGRDFLRLQLASAPGKPGEPLSAMLDLEYYSAQPELVALGSVFEWINQAHNRIEDVFEACIKDRLRGMFEEVTP